MRNAGGDTLALRTSYTYGRFTFVRDSLFSGNDIPGAPRHHLSAELRKLLSLRALLVAAGLCFVAAPAATT